VGYLRLSVATIVNCLHHAIPSDVVHVATTAGAIVLLVLLTVLIVIMTVISLVCLKRTRRWPFSAARCRMEPNVLYTAPASASAAFVPFHADPGNDASCNRNCTLSHLSSTIQYNKMENLHSKTDRKAVSLI